MTDGCPHPGTTRDRYGRRQCIACGWFLPDDGDAE